MSDRYVLRGREVVPEPDLIAWARQFETAERVVAVTKIGESRVSTVFLGLDHQFGSGPPLVFETMVFGGPQDGRTERYSTYAEAEAGHARMVARVEAGA